MLAGTIIELWTMRAQLHACTIVDCATCATADTKQAVKCMQKRSQRTAHQMAVEFLIMKQLADSTTGQCNQHIVKLHQVIDTPQSMYLFLDHMAGGDVLPLIQQRRLTHNDTFAILKQTLLGLQHIHGCGIVHCDIKAENLLVDQLVAPPFKVKIADFGISQFVRDDKGNCDVSAGSAFSSSPEAFARQSCNGRSDMWSVGILLHEMFCFVQPFCDGDFMHFFNIVSKFQGFSTDGGSLVPLCSTAQDVQAQWNKEHAPHAGQRMMAHLLKPNNNQRPSASQLLQESVFVDNEHVQDLEGSEGDQNTMVSPEVNHLERQLAALQRQLIEQQTKMDEKDAVLAQLAAEKLQLQEDVVLMAEEAANMDVPSTTA